MLYPDLRKEIGEAQSFEKLREVTKGLKENRKDVKAEEKIVWY